MHRQSLAISIKVEDVRDTADSCAYLGAFLVEQRGKRDEGCGMLQQAIALYHQMGVPDEEQARERARALGCEV